MINKTKIINIIRNIVGIFLAIIGFTGIISSYFWAGIFMMLSGITLMPIFYEKTKLHKIKYIQIILPIVLTSISLICLPKTNPENDAVETDTAMTVIQENENIEITNLKFEESEIEIDVNETKNIILEVFPENASIENLECCTSDDKIAILEKTDIIVDENKVTLRVKSISEGNCEVFVKSPNGIESNKVLVKVIDSEKIKAEEQTRKEEEEKAKRDAEEQIKKEAENEAKNEEEEKIKKETDEQIKNEETQKSNSSEPDNQQITTAQPKSTSSQNSSNNSHGNVIYRTPYGKRYHYDPNCGGKNSYQTTLDEAKASGLTPCKKCVH